MSEATRRSILQRYVTRYEEQVTPGLIASIPAHGNENLATEIMAVGPIQIEDLSDLTEVDRGEVVAKVEENRGEGDECAANEEKPITVRTQVNY